MRTLHVIMPMAGEGSRFFKEGWATPKPLIQLRGKELFLRAIDSVLCASIPMKYSFIVRQEHIEKYSIDKKIKSILPTANVFSVLKTTRGAVETCLVAGAAISDDDGIIVMDCDLEFRSSMFMQVIKKILQQPAEEAEGGALASFESNSPRYSYAAVDIDGFVIKTAEKEVISTHALCGAYFFSTGKRFKQVAHQLLAESDFNKKEYYVSLLYNYLLKEGESVCLAPLDEYYSYGTPDELKRYL